MPEKQKLAARSRAYSTFTITKMVDEGDERIIEGIATTPTADRVGDIVEPDGAKFALPMPLLWQHMHDKPVGNVTSAEVTSKGIKFTAKIAEIAEAGVLKDRLDEAWQSVKAGLVRAVSIGFGVNEYSIMDDGGYRFSDWEWRELSLVTIPANAEATINEIRSVDRQLRKEVQAPASLTTEKAKANPVSAEAKPAKNTAKLKLLSKKEAKMPLDNTTIAEQIESFSATLAAKSAELDDLLEKSAEDGETLSEEDAERFDTLEAEIEAGQKHLERLERQQQRLAASATPVETPASASPVKTIAHARVKAPKLEKGIAFARFAKSLAVGNGNLGNALEFSKRYEDTSPQVVNVMKAAVAAGTTTDPTWAGNLSEYDTMTGEFIELLRARTFMNQISGWRRVPFKVSVPRQTAGGTGYWVPEGNFKPVTSAAFDRVTLDNHKIAAISAITMELARLSTPDADNLVLNDLLNAVAERRDLSLLDPALAAAANTNPASLTNGVTATVASGTDAAALRADLRAMIGAYLSANNDIAGGTLVMSQALALSIGMMRNALDQQEFPGLSMNGGTLEGIPVVTTQNSPAGQITMIKPSEVMLAEDDSISLDTSTEASLVMDDDPQAVVDPRPMVSMWQTNQIALRAEQMITWTKARPGAVQLITGAAYS